MKAPKRVKIGPFVYRVSFKAKRHHRHEIHVGEYLHGVTYRSREFISVSQRQSEGRTRDTVWHEVMHAAVDVCGLNSDVLKDDDDEERVVRVLATTTLAILRENPELVKYLTHKGDQK